LLHAQPAAPATPTVRWRTALRADAIIDRDVGAQLAIGVAVPAQYNVRLALDVGAGGVRRSDTWRSMGRADLLARWLSDPFRQSRWGINAGGGVGVLFEDAREARVVAIVTVGVEGASDGRWVPGVELGLGGGVRVGVTMRRAPTRRR
jgi:hypothetical protein